MPYEEDRCPSCDPHPLPSIPIPVRHVPPSLLPSAQMVFGRGKF